MQYLLLGVALVLACGAAMFLLRRLSQTQERLAELHQDLRRNELKLQWGSPQSGSKVEMDEAGLERELDQSTQGEQNVEQQ